MESFDGKTRLDPPWKELVKVASEWDYGTKKTHQEIAEILGLKYPSTDYYANVNAAIKELIVIGKRMKNIHDVGYKVLAPVEQIHEAVGDAKRGTSKILDGVYNLDSAPKKDMNDATKRRCENTREALSITYRNALGGVTEAAQIAGIQRKQKMLKAAAEKTEA